MRKILCVLTCVMLLSSTAHAALVYSSGSGFVSAAATFGPNNNNTDNTPGDGIGPQSVGSTGDGTTATASNAYSLTPTGYSGISNASASSFGPATPSIGNATVQLDFTVTAPTTIYLFGSEVLSGGGLVTMIFKQDSTTLLNVTNASNGTFPFLQSFNLTTGHTYHFNGSALATASGQQVSNAHLDVTLGPNVPEPSTLVLGLTAATLPLLSRLRRRRS